MLVVHAVFDVALASPEIRRQRLKHIAAITMGGIVLFSAFFCRVTDQRFNGKPPGGDAIEMLSHDNRSPIYREAIALITAKPFVGYGYGREVLEEVMSARFTLAFDKSMFIQGHNIVLNQILQAGVVGAILLILMFASLLFAFAKMFRQHDVPIVRVAGVCGIVLLVGVLARNMVDDFFIRQNAILFWAMVGILLGLGRQNKV